MIAYDIEKVVFRRGEETIKHPGVKSYIYHPSPTRVRRVSDKRKVIVRFFTACAPAPKKNRGAWDPSYFLPTNSEDGRVTYRYVAHRGGKEPE